MSTQPVVSLVDVRKIYGSTHTHVTALDGVTVDFGASEFTSIMGPSGSGKSTMLHILAGLDRATSGSVYVKGTEITGLGDLALTRLRRERIGFVFQSFNLIPTLDADANIDLPLSLAGRKPDKAWKAQIIATLGLEGRLHHLPSQLSGGQAQRVAIARALVMRPAVIVADEPTGNLDSATSADVLSLLRTAVDELEQSVIMVTHDRHAAAVGDRVLIVRDGAITHDLRAPSAKQIAQVA